GKAEGWVVVFVSQILDCSVEAQVRVESVAAAEINLLVALSQVAIRKKHGGAKEAVGSKGAVIAAADKITAQAQAVLRLGIHQKEGSSVRRAPEWTIAHQRPECPDQNVRKRWIH